MAKNSIIDDSLVDVSTKEIMGIFIDEMYHKFRGDEEKN